MARDPTLGRMSDAHDRARPTAPPKKPKKRKPLVVGARYEPPSPIRKAPPPPPPSNAGAGAGALSVLLNEPVFKPRGRAAQAQAGHPAQKAADRKAEKSLRQFAAVPLPPRLVTQVGMKTLDEVRAQQRQAKGIIREIDTQRRDVRDQARFDALARKRHELMFPRGGGRMRDLTGQDKREYDRLKERYGHDTGISPLGGSLARIGAGLGGKLWDYLSDPGTYGPTMRFHTTHQGVQAAGLPTPKIASDIAGTGGKILAGAVAGALGGTRHPGRTSADAKAITSALMQIPGLVYALANPNTSPEARKLLEQGILESVDQLVEQYGPGTSLAKSMEMSAQMPITSILNALPLAGAGARGASFARALTELDHLSGVQKIKTAIKATSDPTVLGDVRTLRLGGTSDSRHVPIEIGQARSPLFRPVQRGYDVVSRKIPVEARVIGRFAEERRAMRVRAKRFKREERRAIAEIRRVRDDLGRLDDNLAAKLMLTREKPPGMDDEQWLGHLIEDTKQMLAGREVILPKREAASVTRLKKRIATLEKRYRKAEAGVEREIVGRKLAPLHAEIRSARASVRAQRKRAADQGLSEAERAKATAKAEAAQARLDSAEKQLAVAEGLKVAPVREAPESRAEFARSMKEAGLPQEEIDANLQVADLLARAAFPDEPERFYKERLTGASYEDVARALGEEEAAQMLFQQEGWNASLATDRRPSRQPVPGDLVTEGTEWFVVHRYDARHAGSEGGVGEEGRGRPDLRLSEATPEDFNAALYGNTRAWNLTQHTAEELAGSRAFLHESGHAGFVIDPQGDLQNVFRNEGAPPGTGDALIAEGVRLGGITLDAYDPFLPTLYAKHGFVETGRMKFDPAYAPDGMPEGETPDVVFMALGAEPTPRRYFTDWDEAKAWSRQMARPPQRTGDFFARSPGSEYDVLFSNDDVMGHVGLQPGDKVMLENGVSGEIVSGNVDDGFNVRDTRNEDVYENVPIGTIVVPNAEPVAPVFYSHAQRVAAEKGQEKAAPQQWRKLFEKEGVKPEEMEWTGFGDMLSGLEAQGVKSISRKDVIDYFSSPLNAYDLHEVLLKGGWGSHYRTRWGEESYSGLVMRNDEEGYRELVMTVPGQTVFTHGHWQGISNPLIHVRFHEVEEPRRFRPEDGPQEPGQMRRTILIDELQSDWHKQIREHGGDVRGPSQTERAKWLREHSNDLYERSRRLAAAFGLTEGGDLSMLATKLRGDAWDGIRQRFPDDYAEGVEEARDHAFHLFMQQPEVRRLHKASRIQVSMREKADRASGQAYNIERLPPAAPFGGGRWVELGLKRMVAYAAREGYDDIAWTKGVVQAVRYHKVDPETHLGESPNAARPEDHPDYPQQEDYEISYGSASITFEPPTSGGGAHPRLFGTTKTPWGNEPATWRGIERGGEVFEPEPGMPGGFFEYAAEDVPEDLIPGSFHRPDSGPLQGQLTEVTSIKPDGGVVLSPTGITEIEFRTRTNDGRSNDGYIEVNIHYDDRPTEYLETEGDTSNLGDTIEAMGDARFDGITGEAWWYDEVEHPHDRGLSSEFDSYEFNEAVQRFEEEWYGDYGGESDSEGLGFTAEDVGAIEVTGDQSGNVTFYDEILPKAAAKTFKKDGVRVESSTIKGYFGREGTGPASDWGDVPVWRMEITPELRERARAGQRLFQTDHQGFGVKGAVELLGRKRYALRLFSSADTTTVIHELGHIAIADMSPEDLITLEREIAGGKAYDQWTRDDHERYARAWERFFMDGYASTTALRGVFEKLMRWMKAVYNSARGLDAPMSPQIRRVFENRLGKVGVNEEDIVRFAGGTSAHNKLLAEGARVSAAKDELEALEKRLQTMRERGTDPAMEAEMRGLMSQRDKDPTRYEELTEKIEEIRTVLEERRAQREYRKRRRNRLLKMQLGRMERALASPDSPEYQAATNTVDWLQTDREAIIREVVGEENFAKLYGQRFADRRQSQQGWLIERGIMDPDEAGPARGMLPYTREKARSKARAGAVAPPTLRIGKPSTRKLKLNVKNEMILYQQGDYRLDVGVIFEAWQAAQAARHQMNIRDLLWEIGEDVPMSGPPEHYYLINKEGKALPREWDSANDDVTAQQIIDAFDGSDTGALSDVLDRYARNWITSERDKFEEWRSPEGYPGTVRMVHPRVVESILLPYQSKRPLSSLYGVLDIANTLARTSLIYTNPGYIPSNLLANLLLAFANRGPLVIADLFDAGSVRAHWPDEYLRISAEMGQALPEALADIQNRPISGKLRGFERGLADKLQAIADDPPRVAAWIGSAKRKGYKTPKDWRRLLDGKDAKTRADREAIAEEATKAMIDFEKLTPWEQRYLQPVFFVWPFIRGAVAWPIDYVKNFPERAGLAVMASQGYQQNAEEMLGPVPSYYGALVPIDVENGVAVVSNMQSISPTSPLSEMLTTAYALGASFVTGEKLPTFVNAMNYVAPQYQLLINLLGGRNEFGSAESLRGIAGKDIDTLIPFWGLYADVQDESKPAVQLDQGIADTLERRTVRFAPQRLDLHLLNQQAEERKAETPQQKAERRIKRAAAAWNEVRPGIPMPRMIEESIKTKAIVSEMRAQLQAKLAEQADYKPGINPETGRPRSKPKLTELQEAAIVYDVFKARAPAYIRDKHIPTPEFAARYGDIGLRKYRSKLEGILYQGDSLATKAISKAKRKREVAAIRG